MRKRHLGKDGTSFIRAKGQHVVLLPDGTYVDLDNVWIGTELHLKGTMIDNLKKEVGFALSESRHSPDRFILL